MNKQQEALKLALEALEGSQYRMNQYGYQAMETTIAANNKAITAIREALAEQPAQQQEPVAREHITDGNPCWCEPEINYKDPETGISVIVHKEPQ